jgi:hypothetical protein
MSVLVGSVTVEIAFKVTVTEAVDEHPAVVPVTVYVAVFEGVNATPFITPLFNE